MDFLESVPIKAEDHRVTCAGRLSERGFHDARIHIVAFTGDNQIALAAEKEEPVSTILCGKISSADILGRSMLSRNRM
jgi:hypothetical protein